MNARYYLLFAWLLSASCLLAQTERPNQESHQLQIQRSISAITIDGVLDEDAWTDADVAGDFWEKDPRDDVKAHLKTEGRLTFNDQFLYVGITCYDVNDQHIIQTLKRDAGYWDSDGVAVILDPINEASNGFMFGTNPLGVQMEALLAGGSGDGNFSGEWDNIWFVETRQYEDRWTVEMAIPFKTLRFDPENKVWGINFLRNDAKHNQFHVWAPIPRQFWGIDLGYAGQLRWTEAPPAVKGNISLIPYLSAATHRDYEEGGDWDGQFDIGGDAKIAITSSLNLDLTVNPDFSQVEVDRQVTNLTRFSIFFPERRNFFLENSDLFTTFGIPPVRPFFSRRIGLDGEGQAVPILFGARLTGNLTDNLRIGLLNVQTQKNDEQLGQNYTTAAFSQRVLERSTIRGMFINRQSVEGGKFQGEDYNRNASLEFNYQSASGDWVGWSGYHHSFRPGIDAHNAFWNVGGAYTAPNFNMLVDYVNVGENYFADVGFVNRVENYDAVADTTLRRGYRILYTPINVTLIPEGVEWLQNLNFGLENALWFNTDYSMNERNTTVFVNGEMPNSSSFWVGATDYDVDLLFPFEFTDGEPLPAGRYTYFDYGFGYDSDQRKALSVSISGERGRFYNGLRHRGQLEVLYRTQPWGNFALAAEFNQLEFPDEHGKVELWLVGPRAELNFSKNLFWTTFIQYNTQAENFNINSRLQWQFRPLSWLFLVYTDNYQTTVWEPKNRALVLKMNYWLTL